MKNYYQILNVKQSATNEEIKLRYRMLAKRYHPDVNPGNEEAAKRFADISEANRILTDPQLRAEYDVQLKNASGPKFTTDGVRHVDEATQRNLMAQVHAQVQAQVQAQLTEVNDRAYKAGYEHGFNDSRATFDKERIRISNNLRLALAANEKFKKKAADCEHDRSELEQELFDRDRELSQKNEKLQDLEAQLSWLRKAAGGGAVESVNSLKEQFSESQRKIKDLEKKINDLQLDPDDVISFADSSESPASQHEKHKQIKEQLKELDKITNELSSEFAGIEAQTELRRQLDENNKFLISMEAKANYWSKKSKADRRLAKPTLYGTLGVLIWADDEEIKAAYEHLFSHYAGKPDNESVNKLQKLKDAYEVLSDPEKRAAYNASIGCTAERIANERKLVKENERIQAEYRNKLAVKEFWAHFDELSALALAGDADAQNLLGEIYHKGKNVEQDFAQAVYWFNEAMEQSHPAAIYNLGVCYSNGEGVRKNKIIGSAFFRQAANLGYEPDNK